MVNRVNVTIFAFRIEKNRMKIGSNSNQSAYAMEYGTFVGIAWIVCFGLYIGEFAYPQLAPTVFFVSLISVILGYRLVCRYMAQAVERERRTAMTALRFSTSMYFYASLLAAAGHYIYFQFIDKGYLFNAYSAYMKQPDIHQAMTQIVGEKQLNDILGLWQTITPLNFTIELLIINLIIGFILSLPTAIIAGSKSYDKQ